MLTIPKCTAINLTAGKNQARLAITTSQTHKNVRIELEHAKICKNNWNVPKTFQYIIDTLQGRPQSYKWRDCEQIRSMKPLTLAMMGKC